MGEISILSKLTLLTPDAYLLLYLPCFFFFTNGTFPLNIRLYILRNNKAFGRHPVSDVTAQLPQPVPGVFVCWILLALLVPTSDKTTGADGSWLSGVTAGEAERCSSFNIGVASSRSASLPLLTLRAMPGPLCRLKRVHSQPGVSQRRRRARGTDRLIADMRRVSDLIRS